MLAPGVEAPVENQLFTGAAVVALHEDRAVIATPGIVGRVVMKEDVVIGDMSVGEHEPRVLLHRVAGDVDMHFLARRQLPHHLGDDAGNRGEIAGPGRFLVRP